MLLFILVQGNFIRILDVILYHQINYLSKKNYTIKLTFPQWLFAYILCSSSFTNSPHDFKVHSSLTEAEGLPTFKPVKCMIHDVLNGYIREREREREREIKSGLKNIISWPDDLVK